MEFLISYKALLPRTPHHSYTTNTILLAANGKNITIRQFSRKRIRYQTLRHTVTIAPLDFPTTKNTNNIVIYVHIHNTHAYRYTIQTYIIVCSCRLKYPKKSHNQFHELHKNTMHEFSFLSRVTATAMATATKHTQTHLFLYIWACV